MKRLIQRFILRRRLASAAMQIEDIHRQRGELDRLERYLIVQANIARLKLMNMEIGARHA